MTRRLAPGSLGCSQRHYKRGSGTEGRGCPLLTTLRLRHCQETGGPTTVRRHERPQTSGVIESNRGSCARKNGGASANTINRSSASRGQTTRIDRRSRHPPNRRGQGTAEVTVMECCRPIGALHPNRRDLPRLGARRSWWSRNEKEHKERDIPNSLR